MSDRQNRVEFVIQKYRLAEETYIEAEERGVKLAVGRVLSEDALQRFMDGDPSGNFKYLDWMLFQAGGGQDAMDKSWQLWQGTGDADPNSLRNQCRLDFIEERIKGYTDEKGVRHAPVAQGQAEDAWKQHEERSKFEFLMGDQDVAVEEGYGFYRNWPGKDGRYTKIVNTVKLWHMAQAKLLAQNQAHERWLALKNKPVSLWAGADAAFMRKCQEAPPPSLVILDIYSGWKPKEYNQRSATYKNFEDLLRVLADVRKLQILRDIRCDSIYEDNLVRVICPLTIGASIKYGIGKWCVCNRSEFDRSFDTRGGLGDGNWQRYNKIGPLVFMSWKIPMPPWLHKIALNIPVANLKSLNWDDLSLRANANWIDCQNQSSATSYASVVKAIGDEGTGPRRLKRLDDGGMPAPLGISSDERYYQWGGRTPGPAWTDLETPNSVLDSLHAALAATKKWAKTFNTGRIVLDYVTDVGADVDKVDE